MSTVVCNFVWLFICLFIYLLIYLFVCLFVYFLPHVFIRSVISSNVLHDHVYFGHTAGLFLEKASSTDSLTSVFIKAGVVGLFTE